MNISTDKYPAYYCMGMAGLELAVDNAGDNVLYRYVSPTGCKPVEQRAKIRYTKKGRPYFMANGRRVHLDECLRKQIP